MGGADDRTLTARPGRATPTTSCPPSRLWAAQRCKRLLQTNQSEVTVGSPLCALVVTLDQQYTLLAIRSIV